MMTEAEIRKTVAGNIAKYRKQMGMTQIDLSEKINYSDKSISKWERGSGCADAGSAGGDFWRFCGQFDIVFRTAAGRIGYSKK